MALSEQNKTRPAHVTSKKDKQMTPTAPIKTEETKPFKKSVKLPDGTKVTKTGTIKMPIFSTDAQVREKLGDDVEAFAAFGFRAYCKMHANNAIAGTGKKDDDLKSALRNFRNAVEVMVEHMDVPREVATQTMLAKEKFASVKTFLETLANSEKTHDFDFTTKFPVPKLGEDESNESEDEEDEA